MKNKYKIILFISLFTVLYSIEEKTENNSTGYDENVNESSEIFQC